MPFTWPMDRDCPWPCRKPVAGNHNDLYGIAVRFEVVTGTLEKAEISPSGLFMNADAGFDSKGPRSVCAERETNANICFNKRNGTKEDRDQYFDQELYDERYAIERTNAWMDSFRSLPNRFGATLTSWIGLNCL